MKFPTLLLWINAALFLGFGAGFILAPDFFALAITGASPGSASAQIDMRATYGGMGLGIGLWFGHCARRNATVELGLVAARLILGATAAARLFGMFVDGAANPFMYLLLGAELLFVALLTLALRQARNA